MRVADAGAYDVVITNVCGMTVSAPAGAVLVDVLSDATFTVSDDQTLNIRVPSYGTRILIPQGDVR